MKFLMSINHKFMELNPKDLISLVKDKIDGFEIAININNNEEVEYLKELALECKKNNLHFQVHGDSSLRINQQKDFFTILGTLSDILGYKINVVMHPIIAGSIAASTQSTTEYTNKLTKEANLNKIMISLENLNDFGSENRLNKEEVIPIISNNDHLYFTYDIGHELVESGDIIKVDDWIILKMSNIHVHTMNHIYSLGFDHKPIYKHDEHWNKIIKSLKTLKMQGYHGSVVFEYDLYACYGSNLKEKIADYAKSIEYVEDRLK